MPRFSYIVDVCSEYSNSVSIDSNYHLGNIKVVLKTIYVTDLVHRMAQLGYASRSMYRVNGNKSVIIFELNNNYEE